MALNIAALRATRSCKPRFAVTSANTIARSGPSTRRRFYYSEDVKSPLTCSLAKSAILSAALARVPEYGFTTTALSKGAQDAGYPDVSVSLVTRGPVDLVLYHLAAQRLALAESTLSLDAKLDKSGKVREITLLRLWANKPVIGHWQQVR